jgi:predicted esterase/tetratricopeptide (TPR) repeat protein
MTRTGLATRRRPVAARALAAGCDPRGVSPSAGQARPLNFALRLPLACLAAATICAGTASASQLLLRDGRVLKGRQGETFTLAEQQNAAVEPERGPKLIVFMDDELRRTFVSRRQVRDVQADTVGPAEEKFFVRQPTPHGIKSVLSVGPPAGPLPGFDEFGRRTFPMATPNGIVGVIQVISEITPQWAKIEGLNYKWDMRLATSAIPHATLHKILWRQIDPKNLEHRKRIARFYLQCERYEDAQRVLEQALADFPEQSDIKQQLEPTIRLLRQMAAERRLAELRLRRAAGQHQLVQALLKKFPSEDVPGEILQAIREMIQQYEAAETTRAKVVKETAALLEKLPQTVARQEAAVVQKEIAAELDIDTLPRMAAFLQNVGDAQMQAEDKLALALTGWLLGADHAIPNISTALSAYRMRRLVAQYLSEGVKLHRGTLLRSIQTEEAASAANLVHVLTNMKPPFELPEPVEAEQPGCYQLEVPGMPREGPVSYTLQLPPEYNPYRRYPLLVALHAAGLSADLEVDWWAGEWTTRGRSGQAGRQGYIVLAPEWTVPHQAQYQFSAREHAAVLGCLRDACCRFAVDTDRVFLTGYSMGGDAAWDLGLAHPDLWAGVIPIAAESQRYCSLYWGNAKAVPFYLVSGELDGGRMSRNARDLDRYLDNGYNATVVQYLGRGHEHFSDEQLRLFDWMGRFHRDFFPHEFTCTTMRVWDNYFWWAEVRGQPPATVVEPGNWPGPRGTSPLRIQGYSRAHNNLTLSTGTKETTVWLAPQMVDFTTRISISVNGRPVNLPRPFIQPSVEIILEDVRTRGDRQHPFWAKVEVPSARINGEP